MQTEDLLRFREQLSERILADRSTVEDSSEYSSESPVKPGVPLDEACTLVLRGTTQQCVLASTFRETRIVYGGGTVLLSHVLRAHGILLFYFYIP